VARPGGEEGAVTDHFDVPVEAIVPSSDALLRGMGVPRSAQQGVSRYEPMLQEAVRLFRRLASPRAVWRPVEQDAFAEVYAGEGRNAAETPLEHIFPRATRLRLFVVTLGKALSEEIDALFDRGDPALGYVLDVTASEGAERAVRWLGREMMACSDIALEAVLSYSPGYCGWHITGQRKLFEVLGPEVIDVTLNASCLMAPLKSVSGVLVGGPRRIHKFHNSYPFCETCSSKTCVSRVAALGL